MPDPVDPKAFLTPAELAIANMYEVEAIGELLEQKGVLTKDEMGGVTRNLAETGQPLGFGMWLASSLSE